jgi:hypothetical protein
MKNTHNNILYVCVATEFKLYLPYLRKILPELVILGLDTKWNGFITKYKLFRKYLENIDDDKIVVFIDAYDVLPTKKINKLPEQFINFSKKNPNIKIIVGYDKIDNKIFEKISTYMFGSIDGIRLNSGQYIGYARNIKYVLDIILDNIKNSYNKNIDDQVELTKYANMYKNDIYIDINSDFFYVASQSLKEINIHNNNYKYSFIHACGNGFMNEYLKSEYNIILSSDAKKKILNNNMKGFLKKIKLWVKYKIKINNT